MLMLNDYWTWDFWLAEEGPVRHLYFLKAPKSLGDPDLRHVNARIGHAVSTDLREWRVLPDALAPGDAGAWDDVATWTGSVVEVDDGWWMYYTGIGSTDLRVQRIGRAFSTDLHEWHKDPDFLLEVQEGFAGLDPDAWADVCWRDPFVFRDGEGWGMLVTSRILEGPADGRGVVGLLRSDDLVTWRAVGPVTQSGDFGHLEVPQVVEVEGRHFLIFCAYSFANSAARTGRTPATTGTHAWPGESAVGPFAPISDRSFVADSAGSLYAGKVVVDPVTGGPAFLGFLQFDEEGVFHGGLSDPLPVSVTEEGELSIGVPPAQALASMLRSVCAHEGAAPICGGPGIVRG